MNMVVCPKFGDPVLSPNFEQGVRTWGTLPQFGKNDFPEAEEAEHSDYDDNDEDDEGGENLNANH